MMLAIHSVSLNNQSISYAGMRVTCDLDKYLGMFLEN